MHLDSDMSYLWVCVLGNDFMNGGGLFEDAPLPVGEVSMPAPVEEQKPEGINWIPILCPALEHDPILYIFFMMCWQTRSWWMWFFLVLCTQTPDIFFLQKINICPLPST